MISVGENSFSEWISSGDGWRISGISTESLVDIMILEGSMSPSLLSMRLEDSAFSLTTLMQRSEGLTIFDP